MARYRTIKPELFADEKLMECSVDARWLFVGLLPFVDDMGRRQYHPRRIKAEVFPGDQEYDPNVIDALVQELATVGVIELYEISSKRYLRIPNFLRHQIINRPGHCYVPPSPSEGPDAAKCLCEKCKHNNSNSRSKSRSFPQEHTEHSVNTHGVGEHSLNTHGTFSEYASQEGKGRELNTSQNLIQHQHQNQHQHQDQNQPQDQEQHQHLREETIEEKRRAERREVDEIAMQMMRLLNLPDSPLLLQTLTKSIEVKARSRNASVEWAGQHILGKAAVIAAESPPENWVDWFFDSRYEYLIASDPRLKDRRIEARPTCGGSRCSEGWEMVKVGDDVRLRRCPDCVRSWEDAGL